MIVFAIFLHSNAKQHDFLILFCFVYCFVNSFECSICVEVYLKPKQQAPKHNEFNASLIITITK